MYLAKKRQFKESIVDSFYDCQIPGPVVATILTGPDFDRVVNLAYEKLNPIEINSYEIEEDIYNSQLAQAEHMPEEVKSITNIYLQDINKCIVSNFMDVDLMGSVLTQGKIVQNLLDQQQLLEGRKCFIGTFSVRGSSRINTFNYIRNIIGLILMARVQIREDLVIEHKTGDQLCFLKKYKSVFEGRIKSFDIYCYSDKEGPMVTFRVTYN